MKTPFTTEQFFEVFERYNTSVFPAQFLFIGLGIIAIVFLHRKKKKSDTFITGFLAFLWFWIGFVYHFSFFTRINVAAYGFGILFILQGAFFLREIFRNRLSYTYKSKPGKMVGYFFILFGLLIYPVISYLMEGSWPRTISLGLPCPTTILTFGFLILTGPKFPKYLLIIPNIWAVIGTMAAIQFGVYQDYFLLIAAVFATIYLLKREKQETL